MDQPISLSCCYQAYQATTLEAEQKMYKTCIEYVFSSMFPIPDTVKVAITERHLKKKKPKSCWRHFLDSYTRVSTAGRKIFRCLFAVSYTFYYKKAFAADETTVA